MTAYLHMQWQHFLRRVLLPRAHCSAWRAGTFRIYVFSHPSSPFYEKKHLIPSIPPPYILVSNESLSLPIMILSARIHFRNIISLVDEEIESLVWPCEESMG